MSVCGRSHCQISENPHSTVRTIAGIAFIALIIHKFAVDLQLGVGSEYISGIFAFNIAHSFHIHTVMIGLSGFKRGDFVFISAAEEICGNRTGFAVQFPPLAIVCILHAFGTLAGKNGFIAVLKGQGCVIDFNHGDFLGCFRANCFNIHNKQAIHGFNCIGGCRCRVPVYRNGAIIRKGVSVFLSQLDGVHIGFTLFKLSNLFHGRRIFAFIGIPERNRLSVLHFLPAFIGNLIFFK